MVRRYKRKTTRASYSPETLTQCVTAVMNKELSLRSAAQQFGIPRATIQKRLKQGSCNPASNLGRFKRVFSDDMERQLKQRVLEMEGIFYGMSTTDLRRIAYEFAEGNKINHVFSRRKRMAGKDWMIDFVRRHNLSVRTPQSTSMNRVVAFEREKVSRFFELLKTVYENEKIEPHRIYNLDETGVTTVPDPGKILALKGRKQVGRIASGEKGRTVTVVAAVSATGQFVPPAMIFPRQRMNDRLLHGALSGTVGYNSGNGWIDSALFVQYLDHFIKHVKPTPDNKVLLILDNHISHKSLEAIEKAKQNGIVLLTLPPHTSSKLQPLDHSVFKSLKVNYSRECSTWMTNHMGRKITEYDIAAIIAPAFLKAMSPANIVSGFQSTGIWPFNSNVIEEDDFITASAVRNIQSDVTNSTGTVMGSSTCIEQASETSIRSGNEQSTAVQPSSANAAEDVMSSTSQAVGCSAEQAPASDSHVVDTEHPSTVDADSSETEMLPLNVISPRPRPAARPKRATKRVSEQAEIITSSPFKKLMLQKMEAKKAKSAGSSTSSTRQGTKSVQSGRGKGRGKGNKKQLRQTSKVPQSDSLRQQDDDDCACLYCSELYSESHGDDWIKCSSCNRWGHENCTDFTGIGDFVCDFCR